jgi:hypothetical protein
MKELQNKLQILKNKLNKKERSYLCLRSIENFLLYFNQLKQYHFKVENILIEYFEEVKDVTDSDDYFIDFETCKILTKKYIMPLGLYYGRELNFKIQPSLSGVFFWGLQIDVLLLFFKVLKGVDYIPIVTIILFLRWLNRKIFFANKHKAYGAEY